MPSFFLFFFHDPSIFLKRAPIAHLKFFLFSIYIYIYIFFLFIYLYPYISIHMDAYLRARVCVYIYIHIFDRSSNSQRSSHRTFISLRTFSLEKSPLFLVDSRKHVNTYLLSYNGSVRAPGSLFFYFFTLFSPPVSLPLSLSLSLFS